MNLKISCTCGSVQGMVRDAQANCGPRIICLCDDCQAAAHWLGYAGRTLDKNGGTDITPIFPNAITFTQGEDQIRAFRLTPEGSVRWFTACCRSPLGNTSDKASTPYVGMKTQRLQTAGVSLDKAVGPLLGRIQGRYGIPPLPPGTPKTYRLSSFVPYMMFGFKGWLGKKAKPNPFFKGDGTLIAEPNILGRSERERLRPLCGPDPAFPLKTVEA